MLLLGETSLFVEVLSVLVVEGITLVVVSDGVVIVTERVARIVEGVEGYIVTEIRISSSQWRTQEKISRGFKVGGPRGAAPRTPENFRKFAKNS